MNNEPCPNCGEYHCCTELINKQQAEIEALKVRSWEGDSLISKLSEEIEELKGDGKVCARCGAIAYDPVITQTAKTLNNQKMIDVLMEFGKYRLLTADEIEELAILRKAQE